MVGNLHLVGLFFDLRQGYRLKSNHQVEQYSSVTFYFTDLHAEQAFRLPPSLPQLAHISVLVLLSLHDPHILPLSDILILVIPCEISSTVLLLKAVSLLMINYYENLLANEIIFSRVILSKPPPTKRASRDWTRSYLMNNIWRASSNNKTVSLPTS